MTLRIRRRLAHAAAFAVAATAAPVLLTAAPMVSAAPTELFFSEYIEGSSNNKALEIFNGTGADVDLGATGHSVEMFFNGSVSAGLTINLTGTVAAGDVFVLAHGSAVAAILAQADQTNGAGWFNGDDAVVLRRGTAVVDVIGQVGFDPGTQWGADLTSTADNTLRRMATVCAGDPNGTDAFDPAVEWDGFVQDTFAGLGAHASSCDGPVDNPPVPTCPAALTTEQGDAASAPVSATDDNDAIASIAITSDPVAGIGLSAIDLGAGTAQLDVAGSTAPGTYPVVIEFTTDGDPAQSATCTVQVTVEPPPTITPISTVQGTEEDSLFAGQNVTVEGIVTSLFTNQDVLDGFFVQEEDDDSDGDAATSEGIFVFCRGACPAAGTIAVGDLARVRGRVTEFFGMTQVSSNASGGRVAVRSHGNELPTAAPLTLPAPGSTRTEGTFESTEGMIVEVQGTLAVSEYFELARYGQLVLTAEERPYQFTHTSAPSVAGYEAFLADLNRRRIILDDDNNDQNDAVSHVQSNEPYPWPQPGLSITNRLRGGDTIDDLTGVLHWSFAGQSGTDAWRIRPIQGEDYTFDAAPPAPATPPPVGGDVRVASFNVLNYFATIDETSSSSSGPCGPLGNQDCRGADSEAERVRQLDKVVAALAAIDADVVGLIEIQNDAGTATDQIVDALNAEAGPGTYAAIDTGFIGGDAIKVAFIYQPGTVAPIGEFAVLDESVDPDFLDDKNRPVLIQTFEQIASGERFTAAINHLKSKGSDCNDVGDPDIGDGQGNCNVTRRRAAAALAEYLATDPTDSGDPDVVILGDLNAYRNEDPITTLEAAGYTDLHERFEGDGAYGYLFDGQLGYLDHALANTDLLGQVTGTTGWKINADEVPLFDYNDAIRDTPGEATFERESDALPLYEPDPRRSSDHDPVIVGLDLRSLPFAFADLRAALAGMNINHGVKTALTKQLAAAQAALDAGDEAGACAALDDFRNLVSAQRGRNLTPGQADTLTTGAIEVQGLIGC